MFLKHFLPWGLVFGPRGEGLKDCGGLKGEVSGELSLEKTEEKGSKALAWRHSPNQKTNNGSPLVRLRRLRLQRKRETAAREAAGSKGAPWHGGSSGRCMQRWAAARPRL